MRRFTWVLLLLPGCGVDQLPVRYLCDEPLGIVLAAADGAETGYPDDLGALVAACEDEGYHRRYEFSFPKSALLSKQSVEAQVRSSWCRESEYREAPAELSVGNTALRFAFTYQWPTETGKYPETEFVLDRTTLKGGFSDERSWNCRLAE